MSFRASLKHRGILLLPVFLLVSQTTPAQTVPYARSFGRSRDQVEQALKDLQAYSGQKLPILDGFVAADNKPLERYERGFYQFSVELLPGDPGATVVRLSAKITAWYADRDVTKSGYQVLPSNGRLELDLLDRLEEKLTGKAPTRATVQTPQPKLNLSGVPGGSMIMAAPAASESPKTPDEVSALRLQREAAEKRVQKLTAELNNLREIRKNQAHPQNLVTVWNSGTPVYAKGVESARVLFQASENDEFEFLDADEQWIHVGISGDSRGYLRRSAVELPPSIAAKLVSPSTSPEEKYPGFRIEREENGPFPGGWAPLRGKQVKIYTVQVVSQNPGETGPSMRLKYSFALLQKCAKEAASGDAAPEGAVVIFDAADGGIAGATMTDIRRASAGALSRDAFWSQSYLDPVEAFRPAAK